MEGDVPAFVPHRAPKPLPGNPALLRSLRETAAHVDIHETVGVEHRPAENAARQFQIVRVDPVDPHENFVDIHPPTLGVDLARPLAHPVHDLVELRVFEPQPDAPGAPGIPRSPHRRLPFWRLSSS